MKQGSACYCSGLADPVWYLGTIVKAKQMVYLFAIFSMYTGKYLVVCRKDAPRPLRNTTLALPLSLYLHMWVAPRCII